MLLITPSSHATAGAELSADEVPESLLGHSAVPKVKWPPRSVSLDAGNRFNSSIRRRFSLLSLFFLLLSLLSYKKKQERFIHGGPLQSSVSFQSVQMGGGGENHEDRNSRRSGQMTLWASKKKHLKKKVTPGHCWELLLLLFVLVDNETPLACQYCR